MSSVVIVGASRGLGFSLTKIWSENPSNTVIALVRNKAAATASFEQGLPGRANIRIITADLEDFESLKAALEETRNILDNKLDYLIVNAAVSDSIVDDIGNAILNDREQFDQDMLRTFKTNCLGVAHALGLFAPLLLTGTAKKGVVISSGVGDPHWTAKWRTFGHAPYAISKAAVNQVVAKFHAQYAYEGVTISAISPGIIKTEFNTPKPDDPNYQRVQKSFGPPIQASNRFKGPYTPDESAAKVTDVIINHLDLEKNGGILISEYNDQQWV
ncbi:short chain dehydrogenase domain-containing protein [Trichoderma breve]|uniref:Short chain dehydrogenase domain-containing protein n=1 Tax=Trichoderma breve TaxID=2034170 RepID=A0A9W9JTA3_9HYPO|nr:short chain dehydrogenase domain-containing protein [Trichoderma breve]KAJ4865532.1 short chain dehydrogenase domain-containing protein [Trichoderma breve]